MQYKAMTFEVPIVTPTDLTSDLRNAMSPLGLKRVVQAAQRELAKEAARRVEGTVWPHFAEAWVGYIPPDREPRNYDER